MGTFHRENIHSTVELIIRENFMGLVEKNFLFVTEKFNFKKVTTFGAKEPPLFGASVPPSFISASCQKFKHCCSGQRYGALLRYYAIVTILRYSL